MHNVKVKNWIDHPSVTRELQIHSEIYYIKIRKISIELCQNNIIHFSEIKYEMNFAVDYTIEKEIKQVTTDELELIITKFL